jgi:hypothetical protein
MFGTLGMPGAVRTPFFGGAFFFGGMVSFALPPRQWQPEPLGAERATRHTKTLCICAVNSTTMYGRGYSEWPVCRGECPGVGLDAPLPDRTVERMKREPIGDNSKAKR